MKRNYLKKWLLCAAPAVLAALMVLLLPHFPRFTEYILVRGIFRVFISPVEFLISLFPFSVTEVVVIAALPALLTLLTVFIIRMVKSREKRRTAERGARFVCWCLSCAFLLYMVTDGINYSRLPVGELMALPDRAYTPEDLYLCTKDLARKASEARENLPEDKKGCAALTVSRSELLRKADDCYRKLREEYPFLVSGTGRVKSVALSHLWSYTGYTGVYCPWLLEASINTDVPVYEFGHTAAHEVAHTMGFAKEDECNFLGWLACANSDLPDYVYSGYLQAYIYCGNALYRADKTLWKEAYSQLSDGVLQDLKNRKQYWKQFEGKVQEKSQNFNDAFIKANGVKSGAFSYDEMVGLLLRYYDKQGFFVTEQE